MQQRAYRLGHWLSERTAEHEAVAERALLENLRRIRWIALAVLPLSLVGAAAFWYGPGQESAELLEWQSSVGWIFASLAGVMLPLGWAAHAAALRRPAALAARLVSVAAFASMLGFAIAFVTVDQAVTPSITPFVLACVFAGAILLMRPLPATLLFSAAYAAFYLAIGLTQHDPARLLSNRADALGAAALGLLVAALLWRTHTANELLRSRLEHSGLLLKEQQQQFEYLAAHDVLTGLRNRREFARQAEIEVQRALRHGIALCLIVLDLDNFKVVNDDHGHPVGDRALKHIAALLSAAVRGTDLVARLGGEEFIILLPHTELPAAHGLAEKLRHLLEKTPLDVDGHDLRLTASFGVAALARSESASYARLYGDADKALYAAKHGGRNRVETVAGTEPETAGPATGGATASTGGIGTRS